MDVLCDGCGAKTKVPDGYPRPKIQCTSCGIMCDVPRFAKTKQKPQPPTIPEPAPETDRDTSLQRDSGIEANKRAEAPRTKPRKERPPVHKEWESGWSATSRVRAYLICQAIIVASMITGLFTGRDPGTTIVAVSFASLILLFVLGTYDRFAIRYSKKGHAQLWKTWRVCFVPRPEKQIPLHEYDRIRIGSAYGADALDWLFLLSMFCLGVIPALIWGYLVLFRARYSASLSGTGGFVEELLYRSGNLKRVEEIGQAVSDASGMGLDRY